MRIIACLLIACAGMMAQGQHPGVTSDQPNPLDKLAFMQGDWSGKQAGFQYFGRTGYRGRRYRPHRPLHRWAVCMRDAFDDAAGTQGDRHAAFHFV